MLTSAPYSYIYRAKVAVYVHGLPVPLFLDQFLRPSTSASGAAQRGHHHGRRLTGCRRIFRRPYAENMWSDPKPGYSYAITLERMDITGHGDGTWQTLYQADWVTVDA